MENHDWGVLLLVATLGFCCYYRLEAERTKRVEATASIIVACASACDGQMASSFPCECDR